MMMRSYVYSLSWGPSGVGVGAGRVRIVGGKGQLEVLVLLNNCFLSHLEESSLCIFILSSYLQLANPNKIITSASFVKNDVKVSQRFIDPPSSTPRYIS